MTTCYTHLRSPLGDLLAVGRDGALIGLYLPEHRRGASIQPDWREDPTAFVAAREQLAAYFAGVRTTFDLPVRMAGSRFQEAVWARLQEIDYGSLTTYGALAAELGLPTAARAVAAAVARNPVSIVVPCHRVVGADGRLTGYAGGLERKRWLLALERGELLSPVPG